MKRVTVFCQDIRMNTYSVAAVYCMAAVCKAEEIYKG